MEVLEKFARILASNHAGNSYCSRTRSFQCDLVPVGAVEALFSRLLLVRVVRYA